MALSRRVSVRKLGKRPFTSIVIAAAGSSERMSGEDKLFLSLGGIPVLAHSLLAFEKNTLVDEIIVSTRQDTLEKVSSLCREFGISKAARVVTGGNTRLESVMNGVFAVSHRARLIGVHDGGRPLVTPEIINETVKKAAVYAAAVPLVPVKATIKAVRGGIIAETPDRRTLHEAQTPQIFKAELIKAALTEAFRSGAEITDDASAVEMLGVQVRAANGSHENIKITMPEDIYTAEAILKLRVDNDA